MQTWNDTESPYEHASYWERPARETPRVRDVPEVTVETVLVVDDEESIAQLLGEFLESAGYRVLLAGNGHAALTLARVFHPALILADLVMPEMDGHEFVQALRAMPRVSDVPVILMSSTRPTAAVLREVPFIAKPFDLDAVLAYVDRYARHHTSHTTSYTTSH